jgi:hypothetical protein
VLVDFAPFQLLVVLAPFQLLVVLAPFQAAFLAPFAGVVDAVRGPDRGARDCGVCSATVFPSSQGVSSSTRLI